MIDKLVEYNRGFVARNGGKAYETGKHPDLKIAILSCMDTRLTELLDDALGIQNGDVKMITNAGAIVYDNFGDAIRSLLVAVYELHCDSIMVIAHTDCGAAHLSPEMMYEEMRQRGVRQEDIDEIRFCGVDLDRWLTGFGDTEKSVRDTVKRISTHPLMPRDIIVRGFIMDTVTGALNEVTDK